jgi:transmembrane protease serine 6
MKIRMLVALYAAPLMACGASSDGEPGAVGTSEEEIVAGTEVSQAQLAHEFPWMLAFGTADFPFWDAPTQQNGVWCGAVLLNSNWAITAGHCVLEDYTQPSSFIPLSKLKVAHGSALSSKMSDAINGKTTVGVSKVILHPWYTTNFAPDYDIALLRLSTPLPGPYAPLATENLGDGARVRIVGWGSTIAQNGDGSPFGSPQDWKDALRQATLKTVSNEECAARFQVDDPATALHENEYIITPRMLCASGKDLGVGGATSGACFADSGGPLVVWRSGAWRVAALTSSGAGCGQDAYPDTYQRVSGSIATWIAACQAKPNGGGCTLNR